MGSIPARLVSLAPIFFALGLAGCGDDDEEARRIAPPREAETAPAAPEPLYDADGKLLPSGETFFGLDIPRGLTLLREGDRNRVYRTEASLADVQAYFGPRLNTADVERIGEGVVYNAARVQSETGQTLLVTVSILPSAAGTRVELRQHPLAAAQPMTESDYREALKRDVQRWE